MTNEKLSRSVDYWDTIQVTALPPGWVNIWQMEDNREHAEPCPALLLQECRNRLNIWEVPQPDGTTKIRSQDVKQTPPYDTRVVYAQSEPDVPLVVDTQNDYFGYLRTEYRVEAIHNHTTT